MSMPRARPIRFMTSGGAIEDPAKLIRAARRAEEIGYSTFGMADHFMLPLAPLIALQAVASATSRLRLTQVVLAQDFRHPAVLAKELATLDVLSAGRLEIGLGAGWMQSEFEQAGIPFPRPAARIERLEETLTILEGLFGEGPFSHSGRHFTVAALDGRPQPVQRPHPPIMIGGRGPKLLAMAARRADIIQVLPSSPGGGPPDPAAFATEAYQEKIGLIRDAAGERFDQIELGALLLNVTVTDRPDAALEDFARRFAPSADPAEIRSSPVVAIGSLDEVCEKLMATRDGLGLSYFGCPVGTPPVSLAPVIERLAGR
jgi:probable F420-dependent oxidoreductase